LETVDISKGHQSTN